MNGTINRVKWFPQIFADIVLVLVAAPIISVIMWSVGQIVPTASTSLSLKSFLINLAYVWLIAMATRFLTRIVAGRLNSLSHAQQWILTYCVVLAAYFLLQTIILLLIEGVSDFVLRLVVYSIGSAFVTALFIFYYSQW